VEAFSFTQKLEVSQVLLEHHHLYLSHQRIAYLRIGLHLKNYFLTFITNRLNISVVSLCVGFLLASLVVITWPLLSSFSMSNGSISYNFNEKIIALDYRVVKIGKL
jgi:hypothetical protein